MSPGFPFWENSNLGKEKKCGVNTNRLQNFQSGTPKGGHSKEFVKFAPEQNLGKKGPPKRTYQVLVNGIRNNNVVSFSVNSRGPEARVMLKRVPKGQKSVKKLFSKPCGPKTL